MFVVCWLLFVNRCALFDVRLVPCVDCGALFIVCCAWFVGCWLVWDWLLVFSCVRVVYCLMSVVCDWFVVVCRCLRVVDCPLRVVGWLLLLFVVVFFCALHDLSCLLFW